MQHRLTKAQKDKVRRFVSVADADEAEALAILKEARWDLEVGLEMFFTGAHDLASGGAGVSEALEATYAGLGAGAGVGTITCADIGDLYDDPDTVLSAGTCYDSGGKRDDEELALGLGLGLGSVLLCPGS